jgi:dihydroflavonol-4-reductase
MKIYMSGATGRIGRDVFAKVDAIPLVRKKSGLKNEIVTDFSLSQLRTILADADAVIHFAGCLDTWDAKKMEEANVSLTWRITDASPENCKIILASSITIYGKKIKKLPVTEVTPANPDSDYSRTKYEAEKIVRKKKHHCILRLGVVYGPQFADYFKVIKMIEKGRMPVFGKGNNQVSFVHTEDIAGVFPKALQKEGIYTLSGPSATQSEIYKYAADALKVKPPKTRIPVWAGMLIGAIEEIGARFGRKPTLTREHIAILSANRSFDYSKAQKELGFNPRPIKEGIEEMAKEYKKRKA